MSLALAESGPCAGHRCDGCERCLADDCCGADVGEANLPLPGTYPGPFVGEVGALETDNGRLICHICGRSFLNLGSHIRAHRLTSDEYRAYFGLNVTTALVADEIARRLRTSTPPPATTSGLSTLTPEQRSVVAYRREARPETRRKRQRQLSGEASIAAAALNARRKTDPAFQARVRRNRILARRHLDYTQTCPECGVAFCPIRFRGERPKTCRRSECVRSARQRAARSRR